MSRVDSVQAEKSRRDSHSRSRCCATPRQLWASQQHVDREHKTLPTGTSFALWILWTRRASQKVTPSATSSESTWLAPPSDVRGLVGFQLVGCECIQSYAPRSVPLPRRTSAESMASSSCGGIQATKFGRKYVLEDIFWTVRVEADKKKTHTPESGFYFSVSRKASFSDTPFCSFPFKGPSTSKAVWVWKTILLTGRVRLRVSV